MEQCREENAANGSTSNVEPESKGLDVAVESENGNAIESSKMCVSTSSELPVKSYHASVDALEEGVSELNADQENPNCANDESLTVDELKIKDFGIYDSSLASNSGYNVEMNDGIKGNWQESYEFLATLSRNRNLLGSGEEESESFIHDELKPLSINQKGKGLDEVSAGVVDGCKQFISSCEQTLPNNRSKLISSSSFGNFFGLGRHIDTGGRSRGHEANDESHFGTLRQSRHQQALFSEINSDAIVKSKVKEAQTSYDTERAQAVLPDGNITLREWLSSGVSQIIKLERLNLFRQIVQLVDAAHSEGMGFQELRPSKFIFVSLNRVKYTGLLTPAEIASLANRDTTKKRSLELDMDLQSTSDVKQRRYGRKVHFSRHQAPCMSSPDITSEAILGTESNIINIQNHGYAKFVASNYTGYEGASLRSWLDSDLIHLEKQWYTCPGELDNSCLLSSNIYSLGVLLFELLCHFESLEVHCAAMLDLQQRVLPANFLSENPTEAGFCFWLLHPKPSSRPTTREMLQSEALTSSEEAQSGDVVPSFIEKDEDTESELLLHFLVSLKEQKQNDVSSLLRRVECLDADIKEVGRNHTAVISSEAISNHSTTAGWVLLAKDNSHTEVPQRPLVMTSELDANLVKNIIPLEKAYFSMRSEQHTENASVERSDNNLLSYRDRLSLVQTADKDGDKEGKTVDRAGAFFEGVCRFSKYSKFEVCGRLRSGDLLNSTNVICSLSFDQDEDYIAAAGVSKKIKIFEFSSLLDESVVIQYAVLEMSNKSKLSCVCWNNYKKSYLASTDYDGIVQMWDTSTGQSFALYSEHQKRAWSVDFSLVDPAKFASGSDDCSVKLWSITEKNSVGTIWSPANICCVQFSAHSSHLLAFGSADYKIYCYDLRHTRIPWCTLAGHRKAISYVKFLDSETLVSASTDNTLKLWDLKKTSMEGVSTDACSLTFTGHTNVKNFVGLSVLDGYIACGSETNEVYTYHKSLPMPITSHKFGAVDPVSGCETDDSNGQFVSSVIWSRKSKILVSANSSGSMKLLRLV